MSLPILSAGVIRNRWEKPETDKVKNYNVRSAGKYGAVQKNGIKPSSAFACLMCKFGFRDHCIDCCGKTYCY